MRSSDLSHHLKSLITSPASLTIVATLWSIQMVIPDPSAGSDAAFAVFGTFGLRAETLSSGSIWQIFTYGLLHGGYLHVVVNAIGVLLIGSRIERILGPTAMLRACVFGIIGGGILHLIHAPDDQSAPILVGFSGAVMALLLMLTTLSPDSRVWPLPLRARSLGIGLLAAEGILALIDPALGIPYLSQVGKIIVHYGGGPWFEIAHACHFGGGLAGWFYARWFLRNRTTQKSLRRARERGEAN